MWLLLFAPYTRFLSVMLQKLSDANILTNVNQNISERMAVALRRLETVRIEFENKKNEREIYTKIFNLKVEELEKKIKVRL
jgi:hypothetical protein